MLMTESGQWWVEIRGPPAASLGLFIKTRCAERRCLIGEGSQVTSGCAVQSRPDLSQLQRSGTQVTEFENMGFLGKTYSTC
jgi:hypothetical protein